jgi:serine/threonine-protein kinase
VATAADFDDTARGRLLQPHEPHVPAPPQPHPAGSAWAGRSRTPALPTPSLDPLVGQVVDGRYRVLDRLGSGGMGTVYRVMHERMQKAMALKVLHPRLTTDAVVRARFKREARAASLLESRNTVAVFDFGETPEGLLYLAMELLRGRTLADLIRDRGVISPARAARILAQVLRSLEEAHGHGIVHRDIKPDNIFLIESDEPDVAKVLDFGIAKGERITDDSNSANTRSDLVVGTPEYMAPEQARGVNVDTRADLWGVGVILYECLTGVIPFTGQSSVDVLMAVMNQPVPRPDAGMVPSSFMRVIDKALSKKAVDRYQTAAEMRAALLAAQDGNSLPGTTPAGTTPPQPVTRADSPLGLEAVDRDEWEHFARAQKVKSRVVAVGAAVAVASAVVAGVLMFKPAEPATVEVEPNDTAALATLVAEDSMVRGSLHAPLSGKRDEDVYVLELPPGLRVLTASVSTLAPVKLGITVWLDGKLLFNGFGKKDPHPVVQNLQVEGKLLHLRVREENLTSDIPPTPTDVDYQLTLSPLRSMTPGEEREPNESPLLSMTLLEGQQVKAYLSPADDEDWFKLPVASEDREIQAELQPAQDLALSLAFHSADGKRLTHKEGKPGERLGLSVATRKCGVPCYVSVQLEGRGLPSDTSYTLLLK